MAERLHMTLDDIIKNSKKSAGSDTNATFRGGGLGRSRVLGRSRGREPEPTPGPTRRVDNRVLTRMKPYFVPQAFHVQNVLLGGESSSEAGTRLYISNLDYEVTNEDIKEEILMLKEEVEHLQIEVTEDRSKLPIASIKDMITAVYKSSLNL